MDNRSASDYPQPGLNSENQPLAETQSEQSAADQATTATAAAAAAAAASPSAPAATAPPANNQQSPNNFATSQPEARPPGQYAAPTDSRPTANNNNNTTTATNISNTATPQPDYGLNQSAAHPPPPPTAQRAAAPYPEYLARQPQYHPTPNTQAGGAADPSIAASSPTYPPPYSPYNPQGHDMSQFQGHPQHPQMYARPDWHQYGQPQHGLPGPYSAPATTVSSAAPAVTAGPPRPGQTHSFPQVYSFVPIPGSQQHKRPRRRYEEIERMYKCGYNGCEKAYGTLNHLNAHVTMQGHGAKRTPEEFKEIRKEWKARKKEEENQRKALEERERAAAAAQAQAQAQANQVEASTPADPAQTTQTPPYPAGVRPQLPPLGYQPADGQVPGQYNASPGGTLVYPQGNGQMPAGYPANYPHSPYGQGNQVYQQPPTENQSNNYQ